MTISIEKNQITVSEWTDPKELREETLLSRNAADDTKLLSLGYTPEFKRELGLLECFAVTFSIIGLLPSIASTLLYGIGYIGLPGISYGYLIAMTGIIAVSLSMAEICSSMPTSGGLYYAGAVLSPPKFRAYISWFIGWSNWLGQITWAPSVDYALASMIYSLATMNNPQFTPKNWQIYLLSVLLMTVHAVIASMPTKYIAKINTICTVYNFLVLLIVTICLLAGNHHHPKFNTNANVWQTYSNQTEWPNGIAFLMSFLAAIWNNAGFDGAFHLSEECSNAEIAAPRAIVMCTTIGGSLGWLFLLVIAYSIRDIAAVLSSDISLPFATFCQQVVGTRMALALVSLVAVSSFIMGQACMIAASRVAYAYARDGCFPFSSYWSKVNTRTRTPVRAVWGNYLIGILILLLVFNSVAISAIFSLGATAAYVAFIIPIVLKVIYPHKFHAGPWNLGRYSLFVAIYGIMFVVLMIPILQLPQTRGKDLSSTTMNWTALVYWGPMLLSSIWFFISARKWFNGPKVSIDHFNGQSRYVQ